MSRAMAWFRWSGASKRVLMGMRYFFSMLITTRVTRGILDWRYGWFGWWVLVWRWRTREFISFSFRQGNSRFCLGAGIGDWRTGDRGFLDSHGANGGEPRTNGHLAIQRGWRAGVDDAA